MTLITRLSTAFTDTSLPTLRRDPAISNGTMFLWEPKNQFCYPSQNALIQEAEWTSMNNIAFEEYKSATGVDWPQFSNGHSSWASPSNTLYYDAATASVSGDPDGADNRFTGPAFGSSADLFPDATHHYAMSFWVKYTSSPFAFDGGNHQRLFDSGDFYLWPDSTVKSFALTSTFSLQKNSANGLQTMSTDSLNNKPINIVNQFGFAWAVVDGVWKYKTVVNNIVLNNGDWQNDVAGTSTDGIVTGASAWVELHPQSVTKFYRILVEDLTISGRTPEQVWAADWARGNGRFS